MNRNYRTKLITRPAILAFLFAIPFAHAQSGRIQIVIPWAPGGSASIIGRMIGDQLSKQINQPVIILNREGAGGAIGATVVKTAKPDGNTVVFTTPAVTITQALQNNSPFDVRRDLTPITLAIQNSVGVYVNPSLPIHNIKELVAYAKANPGKLNYTSSGIGSSAHMYTELLKSEAGIDMVHIPFTGGVAYPLAVAQNFAQLVMADSLGSPRTLADSGRLRMIAVTTASRSRTFPDVPTIAESGVRGFNIAYWIGFFAPPETPTGIVQRLHSQLTTALRAPAVQDKLVSQGYEIVGSSPADFKTFIAKEVDNWEKVVRVANIPKQ